VLERWGFLSPRKVWCFFLSYLFRGGRLFGVFFAPFSEEEILNYDTWHIQVLTVPVLYLVHQSTTDLEGQQHHDGMDNILPPSNFISKWPKGGR